MIRVLDILLSSVSLVILSPLLIPVAIILRFTGEGEVFFKQKRVGRSGKMFGVYKFATMLRDSPNLTTGTVTLKDDPRVLPFGKFLRRTKLNELPQLLNIFFGDMSIIGPRPQTKRCFDAFPERSREEIIKLRPGLSGLGSVVFRNEEEMMHAAQDPDHIYDNIIMPYKGLLEEYYVKRYSVRDYFVLIFLTVWAVIFPKTQLVWRIFHDLPVPPKSIAEELNWPRAS
ncbi:MAG: sugar transferase [Hyphomicrobiales bacterium]